MTTDLTPASHTPVYEPTEIIAVEERAVACDGGAAPLGHPRVWLRIADHEVLCPYCSRLYVLKEGAGHDSGH
jgi:uncharacterized Zn-finger protein